MITKRLINQIFIILECAVVEVQHSAVCILSINLWLQANTIKSFMWYDF